ncbi:MAG: MTH1187 family thiamine-binding protein [Thermoanaerobaculia bacterium]
MLAELTIIPVGGDTHLAARIAEALKIVDASGLPYQLTPSGTCVEGEWDEIMPVVRLCHDRVRGLSPHVFTTIRIEDEEGERHKLTRNVSAVEERAGRSFRKG